MSMDMDSMDMGDMSSHDSTSNSTTIMTMSMSDMIMTFFTSASTPLFSTTWTPKTSGQYVGTCIFLIALAAIMRVLLALRPILEARLWCAYDNLHLGDKQKAIEREEHNRNRPPSLQALAGVAVDIKRGWVGWRVGSAASRATYELAIAGVGYLLMLAVMTMNVGYFMSVLAGVWVGTFVLGNLSYMDRVEHC